MKSSFLFFPVLLLTMSMAAAIAHADVIYVVPPPDDNKETTQKTILAIAPARQANLGFLQITLEKTTLAEVLAATKIGNVYHMGDAGASTYWLCYELHGADTDKRIWISASGEMGGPDHAITDIHVVDIGKGTASYSLAGCPTLPMEFSDMTLEHGIHLGMSREELIKNLGSPTTGGGSLLEFIYEDAVRLKGVPDPYVEENDLRVKFYNGILGEYDISKVTSS